LQSEAFLRLWTGKEAVLKAQEIGILDGVIEPDFSDQLGAGPWPDQDNHHLATNFGHAFLQWFKYKPDFLICRASLG
jgi:phosphopantetheinyl transferase